MSALDNLRITSPDDYTTTREYNTFIESLVTFYRNHPATRAIAIAPEEGYLFQFDLAGFLLDQGVELEDHQLIMRVNEINSIHEIDENIGTLLIPDKDLVARMKMVYRTRLTAN